MGAVRVASPIAMALVVVACGSFGASPDAPAADASTTTDADAPDAASTDTGVVPSADCPFAFGDTFDNGTLAGWIIPGGTAPAIAPDPSAPSQPGVLRTTITSAEDDDRAAITRSLGTGPPRCIRLAFSLNVSATLAGTQRVVIARIEPDGSTQEGLGIALVGQTLIIEPKVDGVCEPCMTTPMMQALPGKWTKLDLRLDLDGAGAGTMTGSADGISFDGPLDARVVLQLEAHPLVVAIGVPYSGEDFETRIDNLRVEYGTR